MIEDFVLSIHNIIKILDINIKNSLFISNDITMELYINSKISSKTLEIYHKLRFKDIYYIINNLKKKFELIELDSKNKLYLIKKNNVISYKLDLVNNIYVIKFIYADIKYSNNHLSNIYLNLYDNCFVNINSNEEIEQINLKYLDYFELITESIIESVINDFVNLIDLIKLYFKYENKYFKSIIEYFINKINEDKKFKKNIKSTYKANDNFAIVFEIIYKIHNNSNLKKWIKFINKYKFFNKLINEIDDFNTYGNVIDSMDKYIIFLLINKLKMINSSYINYINNLDILNKRSLIDSSDSFDLDDNLNNEVKLDNSIELLNTNEVCYNNIFNDFFEIPEINTSSNNLDTFKPSISSFDKLFINKLVEYRKIKNIDILDKYPKIKIDDIIYLKVCMHILSIMFFTDSNINYNIEYLKLGYIYKTYCYMDKRIIVRIFNLYSSIKKSLEIEDKFSLNYFFNLFDNKKIKEYESNKLLNLPEVKKNFEFEKDVIDIIDYQDTFGLLYEYIIENELNLDEYSIKDLDDLFESQISNVRFNKLVGIND